MATNQIVNAASMVVNYGTNDLSKQVVPRTPTPIPQHLPKIFFYAQKGPSTPELVVGADRDAIYGAESFSYRGIYANHATVFANLANAEGNAGIYQRIVPADAGPEANIIAWLDVLASQVDDYERNTDGSIKTDINGDPIVLGQVAGYRIKWVITHHTTVNALTTGFGQAVQAAGDQTEGATQSVRYPIFELKVGSKGAYGNLSGIRLSAPTVDSVGTMPTKMMDTYKAYPYNISVIRKPDTLTSPKIVPTLFGEQSIMVTTKPGVIDPLTDKRLYLEDVFIKAYQNLTDPIFAKVYGDFGEIKVYSSNIATVLGLFHTTEIPFIDEFSDFTNSAADIHLFNFISLVSSANVPYHSVVFTDSANATRFSEINNTYAAGGSDGTMSAAAFSTAVAVEMAKYADANDQVQDLVLNPESIIYDSGFDLETKYALCDFIARRKDTFVMLSTHVAGEDPLTASEEYSVATALRTRLRNYPESEYFGTPVARGMIIGGSGKLLNSEYEARLPLSAEVIIKAARYMGASNGRWKNGSDFDSAPGSVIENMYDFNIKWVPETVRNKNWDVGLNWVSAYDYKSFFFPALKTIYEDDTSVLNSFFTAMAICQLNKIAHAAWREFTGNSKLTGAQLVQRVNDYVSNATKDIFDGRFVIEPNAFFSDMDVLRGFSWTLPINIYASDMKTVMTTYVQAFRLQDLQNS